MATSMIKGFISEVADRLVPSGSVIDANAVNHPFAVANGWDANKANFPSDFNGMFGLLLSIPFWADNIGKSDTDQVQVLITEAGKVYVRVHINGDWEQWAWATATS